MKNNILLFLFIPLLMGACRQNKPLFTVERPQRPANVVERVDSLITSKVNQYRIPGLAIGMVQGDSMILAKGYGISRIQDQRKVSPHTVFHTASVSKLLTAQAIAQLIAQDRMSLDDLLVDWISELRYQDPRVATITIKQLLNHTAGLPDVRHYHWRNHHQADNSL